MSHQQAIIRSTFLVPMLRRWNASYNASRQDIIKLDQIFLSGRKVRESYQQ